MGLESGVVVSVAVVSSGGGRLPDIIVTPLESECLHETYSVDAELGERPGAIADFLAWMRAGIEISTGARINIALSETITLEGGKRHKVHIVIHPAPGSSLTEAQLGDAIGELQNMHPDDVMCCDWQRTYDGESVADCLQQRVVVKEAWLPYTGWLEEILAASAGMSAKYDVTKVVVSSNPQQRLLRFVFPRAGVVQVRVTHDNIPGALQEMCGAIRAAGYNILSSRLSRTPPPDRGGSISVLVAACEPMEEASREALYTRLKSLPRKYKIENVQLSDGQAATDSLFVRPKRSEIAFIDARMNDLRNDVRKNAASAFLAQRQTEPIGFVFISRRSIDNSSSVFDEYVRSIKCIREAIEAAGAAVVEAPNNQADDARIYEAVFPRMWASDACVVLALDEMGGGTLSTSIGHEIGVFAGRGRPHKVFVAQSRDADPLVGFGNFVGHILMQYPDGDAAFAKDNPHSLYGRVKAWLASNLPRSARRPLGVERRRRQSTEARLADEGDQ